jgi:thioredoxin 1
MKLAIFGLIPLLLLASGCKQVREMTGKLGKSSPPNTQESAAFSEELSGDQYGAFVAQKDKLVVVSFHATWCGPCRQLAPIMASVAAEHGDLVRCGRIDVDQANEVAGKAGVQALPDVRFFRNGKQVDQFVGLIPETELRMKFKAHSQGLAAIPETATSEATPAEPTIQPMKKDWMPAGMERR